MLTLILAESALETIPKELRRYPSVRSHGLRRQKDVSFTILDRSYHHAAMIGMKDAERRGRPDITHFCLLEALGSPLNKEGLLRTFVHTCRDYVVSVDPETRLAKNYNRFIGLMEDLFEYGEVPPQGKSLLQVRQMTISQLLDEIRPEHIVIFSGQGEPNTIGVIMQGLEKKDKDNVCVIIGGFPTGEFTPQTLALADKVVCVDPEMLEAWTIVSRVIYEYERSIALPEKRLRPHHEKRVTQKERKNRTF